MNKIIIIILLTHLSTIALSETYYNTSPAIMGNTGFLRVEPAIGIKEGIFSIGLALRGFNYSPNNESCNYTGGSLMIGLDYGMEDNVSLRFWMPHYLDAKSNLSHRESGFGDIGIGLKYSIDDIFAIEPIIILPTGNGIFGPEKGEGKFRYFTTGRIDIGVKAAITYTTENILLTVGGGYIYHGTIDKYIGSLGLSFDFGKIKPFIDLIAGDRGGFGTDESTISGPDLAYLTPGFVYNLNPDLSILFGIDIRVNWEELFGGEYLPDWRNEYFITAGPGKSQPWAINLAVKYSFKIQSAEESLFGREY
ncbi:hypothetical protein KAX02_06990 [candidate division WOR-3 bacterium]|nr:hypothetical protein [candidate division WOR-3 bacterium]